MNKKQITDSDRLEWLEHKKSFSEFDGGYNGTFTLHIPAMEIPTGPGYQERKGFSHKTLREAIDAAMKE